MFTCDKLKLIRRNVYGRELIYPDCETSSQLVQLTGRKTFSPDDISVLELIGFNLSIRNEV